MTHQNQTGPSFTLGQIIITMEAERRLHPDDVRTALRRHAASDWGEMSEYSAWMNDRAFDAWMPVASLYTDRHGTPFCVTTDGDRARTTVELREGR